MKKLIIWIFLLITTLSFSQIPEFSDSILYKSFYNEIIYGEKKTHQPEVTFMFNENLIVTTMKDQMKTFQSYEEIEFGDDIDHSWKKYKCLDNSETIVYVTFAYEKISDTQIIIIDYGSVYLDFEVKAYPIPSKVFDIFENIERLGYFNDGNFGANYTDKEVYEFLSQFGKPEFILGLIQVKMLGISGIAAGIIINQK